MKSPVGIAKSSNLLGRIFWEIGELDKADLFFKESIGFYREFDIPLGYVNCSLEYAQFLSETGKPDAAKKILEKINRSVSSVSQKKNRKDKTKKYPYTVELTPFIKHTYNRRKLLEDIQDENIVGERIE
jgi:hypothetical protein